MIKTATGLFTIDVQNATNAGRLDTDWMNSNEGFTTRPEFIAGVKVAQASIVVVAVKLAAVGDVVMADAGHDVSDSSS